MFRNREVTLNVRKKRKPAEAEPTPQQPENLERQADILLPRLEKTAMKVFGAFCIYIVLDTFRQVNIEAAKQPAIEEN